MNIISSIFGFVMCCGVVILYLYSVYSSVYQLQSTLEGVLCGLVIMYGFNFLSQGETE